MRNLFVLAGLLAAWPATRALAQEVNPADNPLFGTWVVSEGKYSCQPTWTFAPGTQSWTVDGKVATAPATFAMEGNTIYVQSHPGSGGTVAYIVISPNEIMDTLGTGACHWKRQ